jgi:hypothetical protein
MIKKTGIVATSEVDAHGETFSREALEQLVRQMNTSYLPLGIEHDPREPSVGRVAAARLVTRQDGILMVEADMEIFEDGETVPLAMDSREIPLEPAPAGDILVKFDRSYAVSAERKTLVDELAQTIGARTNQEFKKAVDPISVLTIVGSFAAGAMASGFLKRIGEDAYEAFKAKLKQIFSSKPSAKEQLLVFLYAVNMDGVPINVEVILTNPSPDEIAAYFSGGTAELQRQVVEHVQPGLGIRQITYSFRDGKLNLEFAVRKDAVPLRPARRGG